VASVSFTDAKFHVNPLLCLRDFQFLQTSVTNLGFPHDLLTDFHLRLM